MRIHVWQCHSYFLYHQLHTLYPYPADKKKRSFIIYVNDSWSFQTIPVCIVHEASNLVYFRGAPNLEAIYRRTQMPYNLSRFEGTKAKPQKGMAMVSVASEKFEACRTHVCPLYCALSLHVMIDKRGHHAITVNDDITRSAQRTENKWGLLNPHNTLLFSIHVYKGDFETSHWQLHMDWHAFLHFPT